MSNDRDPADLSAWPTKERVAQLLGKSIKTVERYSTPGRRAPFKLRKFYRANPGRKPCPVYDPADVDRLKRALAAQAIAPTHSHATARVPTNERNGHGGSDAALVVATIRQMSLDIQGIVTGALDRFERLIVAHKEAVPLSEKMLVTPEEAGQLGWQPEDLCWLVREKLLRNAGSDLVDNILFFRRDLEELAMSHNMHCVICECTNDKACKPFYMETAGGLEEVEDRWVSPGLCLSCAVKYKMQHERENQRRVMTP